MDGAETENESSGPVFKLEAFEGPLDLLLHLIRINEIEITDIPIVEITDQYLAVLDMMSEVDIDLGSDFILMAANLIYIKTKILLPDSEEGEELREELVERLLEHEQYRAAADALARREEEESHYWARPETAPRPKPETGEEVLIEADLFDLISAFQRVMRSLGVESAMALEPRQFAVEDKIKEIKAALEKEGKLLFSNLMRRYRVKRELIAVFLAMLELMRKRRIRLMQSGTFGEIVITPR